MKLFILFILLFISAVSNARDYPAVIDSWKLSYLLGEWQNSIHATPEGCKENVFIEINIPGHTYERYLSQRNSSKYDVVLKETRISDGKVRELAGTCTANSFACPYGGDMTAKNGSYVCVNSPDCPPDKPEQPDGTCGLPACPPGEIRYEDGVCAPPPDCAGAAGEAANGGLISAITNCFDYCEVGKCHYSLVPWKDGKPDYANASYACYFTGKSCLPSDPGEGGDGDPGGGDPGGGDPGGGDPGGGDPGGDPGGNPGGTPGGNPGGTPGGEGQGEKESSCPEWLKWICGDGTVDEPEIPDGSQFDDAFFKDTFSSLTSFSMPSGSGSCSPMTFTLFDRSHVVTVHCDMVNEHFPIFRMILIAIWSLVAFRIVMSA
jgi:hypothetical protein